jgi:hypothetical protein
LAPSDYASGGMSLKRLKRYLKPQYRHALDSAIDAADRP